MISTSGAIMSEVGVMHHAPEFYRSATSAALPRDHVNQHDRDRQCDKAMVMMSESFELMPD